MYVSRPWSCTRKYLADFFVKNVYDKKTEVGY